MLNRTTVIGLVGSAIVALCCFTPLLVVTLAALGLGATLVWLDFVLLPLLAVFVLVSIYGLWKGRRTSG